MAYRYGIAGPFWYASGASVQILLFAILAIEVKRKAPNSHTFLEIVRARYGGATHAVFLVFGLSTNVIVTAMLLLGGSAGERFIPPTLDFNTDPSNTSTRADERDCY